MAMADDSELEVLSRPSVAISSHVKLSMSFTASH
jgi:hypothetical protein